MSLVAFLTTALESALETGMATPEDLLRHATPEVLGVHLPRPVWTRLLTACLGAPRTDARLIVDTMTIATMCEHVPVAITWACVAEIAQRALGRSVVAAAPAVSAPSRVPSAAPAVAAPVIPPPPSDTSGDIARVAATPLDLAAIAADKTDGRGERVAASAAHPEPLGEPPPLPRAPAGNSRVSATTPFDSTPSSGRAGGSAGAIGRVGAQRADRAAVAAAVVHRDRLRGQTDVGEQWKKPAEAVPVDDDQLIDWAQSEETVTTGDKYDPKR